MNYLSTEGPHFSFTSTESNLDLRDYFAANVVVPPEDEVPIECIIALAGRDYPKRDYPKYDQTFDTAAKLKWAEDCIKWDIDWRAAYKFMMADAMLKARLLAPKD